jgi:hypothetical protein
VHCANCLVGEYATDIGKGMRPGNAIEVALDDHERALYVCGVASPYVWAKNFHAALRPAGEASALVIPMWNGDELHVQGAELMPINRATADSLYAGKPESFLSCRNFQFGAEYFPPTT